MNPKSDQLASRTDQEPKVDVLSARHTHPLHRSDGCAKRPYIQTVQTDEPTSKCTDRMGEQNGTRTKEVIPRNDQMGEPNDLEIGRRETFHLTPYPIRWACQTTGGRKRYIIAPAFPMQTNETNQTAQESTRTKNQKTKQ